MAHMIDMSNGKANMAYVGETPWHGLGQKLSQGASIDQWRVEAGLDWSAKRAKILFADTPEMMGALAVDLHEGDSEILFRSDNRKQLGIVSPSYKIVQPGEVLEFFRDIVAAGDMALETAGALDDGKKVWALAKTHQDFRIMGQDQVEGYLLLVTSFDGTLSTKAQFTSVRVVCNNTLQISLANNAKSAVSIPHSTAFDATGAKINLGLLDGGFKEFEEKANILAQRRVTDKEAMQFILNIMAQGEKIEELSTRKANIIRNIYDLYNGRGMGAQLKSSANTAWGVVNAFTQYVDHIQGNNVNNRFRSAQFGLGAKLKNDAFTEALKLAA